VRPLTKCIIILCKVLIIRIIVITQGVFLIEQGGRKNKMTKKRIEKTITNNILENAGTATAWVFVAIAELGMLTIQAFLSSSMNADLPYAGDLFDDKSVYKKKKYKEVTVRQSLRRLEKHGFIERKNSKYALTAKGRNLLKNIRQAKKEKAYVWDGKYRVVIFDIPEEKRQVRNWLRRELDLLKYKKLQESVFVGKHPLPRDLIKDIKKNKIGGCVNYLLAEKVYKNIV